MAQPAEGRPLRRERAGGAVRGRPADLLRPVPAHHAPAPLASPALHPATRGPAAPRPRRPRPTRARLAPPPPRRDPPRSRNRLPLLITPLVGGDPTPRGRVASVWLGAIRYPSEGQFASERAKRARPRGKDLGAL